MRFLINDDNGKPVFERFYACIYVIMVNEEDTSDRRIFIYNMDTTSHNSLVKTITLSPDYAGMHSYLFVQKASGINSVFIYLFFEGQIFQFINFELFSIIIAKDQLVQPFVIHEGENAYQDVTVELDLFPLKTSQYQHQNETLNGRIYNSNQGLIIVNKVQRDGLLFSNERQTSRIATLDHFDGFNMSFRLADYDRNSSSTSDFNFIFSEDKTENYSLKIVKNSQRVIDSFPYL